MQQHWQQTRLAGIASLHSLTEAAKQLDALAAAQHPGANHFYYSTFIKERSINTMHNMKEPRGCCSTPFALAVGR